MKKNILVILNNNKLLWKIPMIPEKTPILDEQYFIISPITNIFIAPKQS